MKNTYYSSLFSMYAQIAGAISRADKKRNVIINEINEVGIKFDNISDGKLYPELPGIKKYSLRKEEANDGPVKL